MVHAGIGIEGVDVFKPANLEIGRKGRNRNTAAGPKGSGHAVEHDAVGVGTNRSCSPGEAKGTLAERDHGIELAVEGKGSSIESLEGGSLGRSVSGEVDEGLSDIDPMDGNSTLGERVRVSARAATNIENPHTGL